MLLGEKIEQSMKICPEITDRHRKLYVRPLFRGLRAEPYKWPEITSLEIWIGGKSKNYMLFSKHGQLFKMEDFYTGNLPLNYNGLIPTNYTRKEL